MPRRVVLSAILVLLIAAVGCVDADPPDTNPNGLEPPDLTGTWSYEARLFGPATVCEVTGVTLTIEQTGEGTFDGTTDGGTLECIRNGEITPEPLPAFPLEDGNVAADGRLIMSFGDRSWRHAGSVAFGGGSMGGETEWEREFPDGEVITLDGDWVAVRQ